MGDVQIAEGVVSAEDGGEAFVLDTRSRHYYRLNPAGLTVWRALESGVEPLAALAERYPSITTDELARDVEGIMTRLLDAGLVQRSSTG